MEAKRKPGRPKIPDGIRKTVMLDRETIERAEALGAGNLSLGIRLALSQADTQEDRNPAPTDASAGQI